MSEDTTKFYSHLDRDFTFKLNHVPYSVEAWGIVEIPTKFVYAIAGYPLRKEPATEEAKIEARLAAEKVDENEKQRRGLRKEIDTLKSELKVSKQAGDEARADVKRLTGELSAARKSEANAKERLASSEAERDATIKELKSTKDELERKAQALKKQRHQNR